MIYFSRCVLLNKIFLSVTRSDNKQIKTNKCHMIIFLLVMPILTTSTEVQSFQPSRLELYKKSNSDVTVVKPNLNISCKSAPMRHARGGTIRNSKLKNDQSCSSNPRNKNSKIIIKLPLFFSIIVQ